MVNVNSEFQSGEAPHQAILIVFDRLRLLSLCSWCFNLIDLLVDEMGWS